VNQLFGQLKIGSNRGYSYVRCTLLIGNAGIGQASALFWLGDLYLPYYGYVWKTTTIFDYCFLLFIMDRKQNEIIYDQLVISSYLGIDVN